MTTPRWHELKTSPESFDAIRAGVKLADLRLNDRDYQKGDILALRRIAYVGAEAQPDPNVEPVLVRVTHVQAGGQYGLDERYVMLSIERVAIHATHG